MKPHRRMNLPSINLALQGGGSHGAFTWGVLDAILEDGRVALEGIGGTSTGDQMRALKANCHAAISAAKNTRAMTTRFIPGPPWRADAP